MYKKFFESLSLFILVFSVLFAASSISAQERNVPIEKIQESIDNLSSYNDVPSSINCRTAQSKAEKIICGSGYLTLMERLDTRAAVYAYENGTGTELPHNQKTALQYSLIKTIRTLKTEQAIRNAFIRHTNDSLGGISPYYKND